MEIKDQKLKMSFIDYLEKHPEQRFWQAVRNWAKVHFVLTSTHFDPDMLNQKFMKDKDAEIKDTFYL
jgi:hypothetical protein